MPMYALATLPLIAKLLSDVFQVWYADDACAGGDVTLLYQLWKHLCGVGPQFGCNANAVKTWFVVKPAHLAAAKRLFALVQEWTSWLRDDHTLVQLLVHQSYS